MIDLTCISRRLESIKELKDRLEEEKQKQEILTSRMREQSEVKVILRYALWNIGDILNPVGKNKRILTAKYATEELKLPLLNFETFNMRSYPPEMYEEDSKSNLYYQ